MRSIRLIAVLGILAAASVVSTHSPPPAPSEVQKFDRSLTGPTGFPTLAVYQQDLEPNTVSVRFEGSMAALPSMEQGVSAVALTERRDGALDLVTSGSTLAQTTTDRGVDTSKRMRVALGDPGRTPLRI